MHFFGRTLLATAVAMTAFTAAAASLMMLLSPGET